MNYRYSILAGIHCTINDSFEFKCFPQTQIFNLPNFGVDEFNHKSSLIINKVFTIFIESLERLGLGMNFHRRGLILNIPDMTQPETRAYISAVETDMTRIRPSLSLGFEACFPTAQIVSNFNFDGPVTSLIDSSGGLLALGYACNLLTEGKADLIIVGNMNRTETKDIRSFRGSITLAAISLEDTCNIMPVGLFEDWGVNLIFENENHYVGKNLFDLLMWVSDSSIPNRFYSSNIDGSITFLKADR